MLKNSPSRGPINLADGTFASLAVGMLGMEAYMIVRELREPECVRSMPVGGMEHVLDYRAATLESYPSVGLAIAVGVAALTLAYNKIIKGSSSYCEN